MKRRKFKIKDIVMTHKHQIIKVMLCNRITSKSIQSRILKNTKIYQPKVEIQKKRKKIHQKKEKKKKKKEKESYKLFCMGKICIECK